MSFDLQIAKSELIGKVFVETHNPAAKLLK